MNGDNITIISIVFNITVALIMICSGIWVGLDARKNGRSKLETIAWAIFAGWFFIIGPLFYLFFKNKFYKQ